MTESKCKFIPGNLYMSKIIKNTFSVGDLEKAFLGDIDNVFWY